ncbi:MAG: carboxypeptidase regulatory-like domain-containing protein [Pedobacter sp.]|nr:MAG: carboxypeptidase regulatory-like domain-containing protein [Pedobacter sp.]
MKLKPFFAIIFLFAAIAFGFKADETPLEKLLKQLAKITASYPQEKVHLHLDKPYYAIGEDIWLKAYLVTAERNEPSFMSKVLYADLIDEKNEIKKRLTFPVANGFANGNITLIGDSLTSGNYRIRAYSNYMRNFDSAFFFEKQLIIGNVLDSITPKIKEKKFELSLQFFPEGGYLVDGIKSKVGVKAVSSSGYGINLSGYIENKNGDKVANFTTEHAGMGMFSFIPSQLDTYTAVVKLQDGTIKSFKLPKTEESGYTLSVTADDENVNIRISASSNLVNGKEVYIIAQANGKTYLSLMSNMDKPSLTASLSLNKFATGITHFTLFNGELKPLAERLVFINHNDDLKINIKESVTGLVKKKTDIEISVSDLNENPIDGNFSIAVIDESKVKADEDDETSILSNLLLTSDLKGFIEKPNYYFNPANTERKRHLDHLLLTQGWSRFKWDDITNSKEPEITFKPEQSLEITGLITSWSKKPLTNAKVSLFASRPGFSLNLDTTSNSKGNFYFDRLDIPDSTTVMIQTKSGKADNNINISLNQRPSVDDSKFLGNSVSILPYLQRTKEMFVELENNNQLSKGILLKTVKITGQRGYFLTVLGDDALNGAVYITTKRGNELDPPLSTNVAKIKNAGYTTKKEFYAPDYDDPKTNQQLLDLRSTIYWNPNVNTDASGKATVSYFNASKPGTYRVTIEGMDAFGNIGRKTYTYEVKQNL